MNKWLGFVKSHTIAACLVSIGVLCASLRGARFLWAQSAAGTTAAQSDGALIADFRRVEVASVADALEQLTGKRMYMSHRMHPILTTKFAGCARTVQLKKGEGNSDPAALNGMLEAIDQGAADSVYVMVVEDIAGMGGLREARFIRLPWSVLRCRLPRFDGPHWLRSTDAACWRLKLEKLHHRRTF